MYRGRRSCGGRGVGGGGGRFHVNHEEEDGGYRRRRSSHSRRSRSPPTTHHFTAGGQPSSSSSARFVETISIPLASVGCVMGPRGSIMKQLRGQSGALIVLEQRDQMRHDQHRRHVTIKGTPAQIATAKILIAERVSRDVLTNRSASLGGSGGGIDGAFETSTMVGASESDAFGDERAADDGRYDRRYDARQRRRRHTVSTRSNSSFASRFRDCSLSPPLIPATPARRVNSEGPPSVLNFADLKIGQCRDDGEDVDSPDGDILPNTPSLGVDVGGVLLAYGPDGSRGFSRRRSTIDGGLLVSPGPSDSTATAKSKHKPMHPIVSEDDLLIDIRVAD